jgi:hypothetical protein
MASTYLPIGDDSVCRTCVFSQPEETQIVYIGDPSEAFPSDYEYEAYFSP